MTGTGAGRRVPTIGRTAELKTAALGRATFFTFAFLETGAADVLASSGDPSWRAPGDRPLRSVQVGR